MYTTPMIRVEYSPVLEKEREQQAGRRGGVVAFLMGIAGIVLLAVVGMGGNHSVLLLGAGIILACAPLAMIPMNYATYQRALRLSDGEGATYLRDGEHSQFTRAHLGRTPTLVWFDSSGVYFPQAVGPDRREDWEAVQFVAGREAGKGGIEYLDLYVHGSRQTYPACNLSLHPQAIVEAAQKHRHWSHTSS